MSHVPMSNPVIMVVESPSPNSLHIRWQYHEYAGEDNIPIRGFVLYYRPYDSEEDFESMPLTGKRYDMF